MRHLIPALLGMLLLTQCGLIQPIDRRTSEWDEVGIWKKLPGSETDYVPRGFHGTPKAAPAGEWVHDAQDGTRFYVPAEGTREFSAGVLRVEARKATNRYTVSVQRRMNAVTWAFAPVNLPFAWARNLGPSDGSGSEVDSDSGTDTTTTDSSTECKKDSHKDCSHDHKDCKESNSKH
jgi:hypothetical protein